MLGQVDLDTFVDRDEEQKDFMSLLEFRSDLRVLAIKDKANSGKSHLLEKLMQRCQSEFQVRVSLAALDQLESHTPVDFLTRLVSNFGPGPTFRRFDEWFGHYWRGRAPAPAIRVDVGGANFSEANNFRITGVDDLRIGTYNEAAPPTQLTPNERQWFTNKVVEAFVADLSELGADAAVVILVDAFEKCQPDLRRWFSTSFLASLCFDSTLRPKRLVVAIAGQNLPRFDAHFPANRIQAVVKIRDRMSPWTEEIALQYWRLRRGGTNPSPEILEALRAMAQAEMPPGVFRFAIDSL